MSKNIALNVTGMKCGGCETTVRTKLEGNDGILALDVSHKVDKVEIEFDAEKTSLDEIKQVITDAGFTVEEPSD